MTALDFSERSLAIPGARDAPGYPPGLAYEGRGERVLFSVHTRSATARIASMDIASGRITVGARVLGELRDAWRSPDGTALWLLTVYGLYRADPLTLSVNARIKVPKYLWEIVPFANGSALALSQVRRSRTPVVRTNSAAVTTITSPTPNLAMDSEGSSWLISFWAGEAREFDRDLRPTGQRRSVPYGLTPKRIGDLVYYVGGEVGQHPGSSEPSGQPWINSTNELSVFSLKDWRIMESSRIGGLAGVLGLDASHRLIAIGGSKPELKLLLIDPTTLKVVASHELIGRPYGMVIAGGSGMAYRTIELSINFVEWR